MNKEELYLELLVYAFNWFKDNVDKYDDETIDQNWHMLGSVVETGPYWTKEQHQESFLRTVKYTDSWKEMFGYLNKENDVPVVDDVPSQEEVDVFLDKLRESGTDLFFSAEVLIMKEFQAVTKKEAEDFLIRWMDKFSPIP